MTSNPTEWIPYSNGQMLNKTNIINLKVNKNTSAVVAECVGGRTIEIAHCEDRNEARQFIAELTGHAEKEPPAPKKEPASKKPASKK